MVSVKMRTLIFPPKNAASSVKHSRAVYIAKAQDCEEMLWLAVNTAHLQSK